MTAKSQGQQGNINRFIFSHRLVSYFVRIYCAHLQFLTWPLSDGMNSKLFNRLPRLRVGLSCCRTLINNIKLKSIKTSSFEFMGHSACLMASCGVHQLLHMQ